MKSNRLVDLVVCSVLMLLYKLRLQDSTLKFGKEELRPVMQTIVHIHCAHVFRYDHDHCA